MARFPDREPSWCSISQLCPIVISSVLVQPEQAAVLFMGWLMFLAWYWWLISTICMVTQISLDFSLPVNKKTVCGAVCYLQCQSISYVCSSFYWWGSWTRVSRLLKRIFRQIILIANSPWFLQTCRHFTIRLLVLPIMHSNHEVWRLLCSWIHTLSLPFRHVSSFFNRIDSTVTFIILIHFSDINELRLFLQRNKWKIYIHEYET